MYIYFTVKAVTCIKVGFFHCILQARIITHSAYFVLISLYVSGCQVPIFSYFFLFFSAYSYFSYFLAISSYFSYFLAILLTISKYLLEI